ncbi:hypothetical protein ACFL2S_07360 [Thermodesulfobacteriota bacterium]
MFKGLITTVSWFLLVILIFSLSGCGGWNYKNLKRTDKITGEKLRQTWNDYTVYFRPPTALVYKIKNDKKIQLSINWVKVTEKDEVTSSAVYYLDDVLEIAGQNNELYGYLIYTYRDSAFVRIIDDNTVELIYTHQIKEGP